MQARFVCVGACVFRGGPGLVAAGLGSFGWSGSDAWLVFTEPVVEGDAGALVV